MSDIMQRIAAIQSHPDTVGCVNFYHKLHEGQGRNGPRLCSAYVFSIKNWVQGEGETPEAAFNDLWQQLVRIVPSLAGGAQVQNTSRYFISTDGKPLLKLMPPLKGKTEWREIGVEKGWNVTLVNDATLFRWDTVNWLYYINEARKLCLV